MIAYKEVEPGFRVPYVVVEGCPFEHLERLYEDIEYLVAKKLEAGDLAVFLDLTHERRILTHRFPVPAGMSKEDCERKLYTMCMNYNKALQRSML